MVYYKHEQLLEDFRKNQDKYQKICGFLSGFYKEKLQEKNIPVFAVETRVKTEASLIGKLQRKGEKYTDITDITDLCGTRIICYFSDDVDKIADLIGEWFDVDKENSIDKRKLLDPSSFGYLSIHFICSMTEEKGFPKELCGVKFELQIRSVLQHAWSAIDHDLSYKAEVGIPNAIIREFARVAGLLEIADEKFIEIRDRVNDYISEVKNDITEGKVDDVKLDVINLFIYVTYNKDMKEFYNDISTITATKINYSSAENYIQQLNFLGIETLKQLHETFIKEREFALRLIEAFLVGTGVEELSLDIGLRFLCIAKIIDDGYTIEKATEFFNLSMKNKKKAREQAERLFSFKEKIKKQ